MQKKDKQKQDRQRQQQYIDAIQSEYLTHRFRRIMAILSKNYLYSFNLLQNINSLYGSSFQLRVSNFALVLDSIILRHKNNILRYVLRNVVRKQELKLKASSLFFQIIQRQLISYRALFLVSLKGRPSTINTVAKDKQLFLIIAFSNVLKIQNSTKIEAFQAIKSASYQKKIAINKAKVIILEYTLSTIINSSKRKAFDKLGEIFNPQVQMRVDEQNESDQEEIMIDCFKSLAFNLGKIKDNKKENRDIVMVYKQEATKNIFDVLDMILSQKLRWTLWQLKWGSRNEYTPQTYQILVRQIAVLEKEYQSN